MNRMTLSRSISSAAAAVLVGTLVAVPTSGSAHAESTTAIDIPSFVSISESATTEFQGDLYFGANDGVHGYELWRTDGTTSGTQRVTDLDDRERSFDVFATSDRLFLLTGRSAVLAYDGVGAPVPVTGFGTRPSGDQNGIDGVLGDRLLLTGQKFGLYAVDPGSVVARPISPGFAAFEFSDHLSVLGDHAYFSGRAFADDEPGIPDDGVGVELLRTDGVTTELVADIYPGSGDSFPRGSVVAGGHLFFSARGDARSQGLWVSDGTAEGTHLVRNHREGESTDFAEAFVPHGEEVYYQPGAGDQLWRTDGSADGTHLVLDLSGREDSLRVLGPTSAGPHLYFLLGSDERSFLARTDGTPGGTRVVAKLPGSVYDTRPLSVVGDRLYFVAPSPFGSVLWRSDGTAAGTFPVSTGSVEGSVPTLDPAVREVGVLDGRVIVSAAVDGSSPAGQPRRSLAVVDPAGADSVRRRAIERPSVTGLARRRGTLTVSAGVWTASPNRFTYQWFRNGALLEGETSPTLLLRRGSGVRVGDALYAVVNASGLGSASARARSATVRVTRSGRQPVPVTGPTRVRGKALVGTRLHAVAPHTPPKTRLSYGWLAGGRVLRNAHGRTLSLKRTLVGKRIRVRITMHHSGYEAVRRTSHRTGPVRR